MLKRITALFLAIVTCFTLFACGKNTEQKPPQPEVGNATPLLYKVTDDNGNVAWLFGSIHVGREDFYSLPSYVMDAYKSSDALAVEFDIIAFETDTDAQVRMIQALMCTDGRVTKDYLSEETYNAALAALADNGLNGETFSIYAPVMWWSLIETYMYTKIGANHYLGVDRHLLKQAKEDGKEILEVESSDSQYSILGGFSEELQEMLLMSVIESYNNLEESKQEIIDLMDVWASGDEAKFAEILGEQPEFESEEEAALYKEYNDAMLVTRNESMTKYAENALKSGKEVFICLGAAHIVGDGAIAKNLQELGYTVEVVK